MHTHTHTLTVPASDEVVDHFHGVAARRNHTGNRDVTVWHLADEDGDVTGDVTITHRPYRTTVEYSGARTVDGGWQGYAGGADAGFEPRSPLAWAYARARLADMRREGYRLVAITRNNITTLSPAAYSWVPHW